MDTADHSGANAHTTDFAGSNSAAQGTYAGATYGSAAPRAVTSAQAAINARFAEQKKTSSAPKMVASAREAVNAAAGQSAVRSSKSAANLHHGSIERQMESTRTSASALLRRAESERPVPTSVQTTNAADPLARESAQPAPKKSVKTPSHEIPVVRTSLKLGANARPKPAPVVLPPGARMARSARPVGDGPKGLAKLLQRAKPAQLTPSSAVAQPARAGALASGVATPSGAQALSSSSVLPSGAASPAAKGATQTGSTAKTAVAITVNSPARAARPKGPVRDPQMRSAAKLGAAGGKAPVAAVPRRLSTPLPTPTGTAATGMTLASQKAAQKAAQKTIGRPSRFRPKPKDYAATAQPVATDSTYVMTEPPKLNLKKLAEQVERAEFGVVEPYHPERVPEPIGDHAPIGSFKAQPVAAGHGGAAEPKANIKADNSANYSFLRKKEKKSEDHPVGAESPFLKSVNVEKRPLSDNATLRPAPSVINEKANKKASRKNVYAKKHDSKRQDLPARPTVIVPSSRRSKAPLFFLILLTIILGAAVGAAAYLCFFQ